MARPRSAERSTRSLTLRAQRGSLVALKSAPEGASNLAVVVSNDIQNEASDYLLIVPLQRRTGRLKAPFAIDLGRSEGMRDLHSARCDWISRIHVSQLKSIERAKLSDSVLEKLAPALKVALGIVDLA